MSKARSTGNLNNSILISDTGAITFVSGSTTLLSVSTTGQLSGSTAVKAAATASYADSFTVAGNLTAQTLVVQTITSSVDYVTGSTRFGSTLANTHVFTGSVNITGSNHSLYGNVGIGTISPNALFELNKSSNSGGGSSFPRINVINSLATQGDGSTTYNFADIHLSSGNGAVDMYLSTTYAAGTWAPQGIINVATNHPLAFKTNNTEWMRITNDGKVLIGTTNSSGVDKIRINNDGTAAYSTVNMTNANSTANMYVGVGGSAVANTSLQNNAYVWNAATSALVLGTNDVERMRIYSGGGVRIKQGGQIGSPPTSGNFYNGLTFENDLTTHAYSIGYTSGGNFSFNFFNASNSTYSNLLNVTSGGNVLIGTTSDNGNALIVGKSRSGGWQSSFVNTTAAGTTQVFLSHGDGYGAYVDTGDGGNSSSRYIFKTVSGGIERLVVRGDGKTSLSSTATSFGQFQIGSSNNNGEASICYISGVSAFGDSPTSVNGNNYIWAVGANVFGINGDNWGIGNKGNGNYVAKIAYNSTSWTFSSDIRLKNVIGNIENVLEPVCKLNPVYYSWKSDDNNEKKLGFIAQEVYEQFPDIVDVPLVDEDENGNKRYWGLNYGDLTPILVKAIQELKAENDTLKEILQRNNIQ